MARRNKRKRAQQIKQSQVSTRKTSRIGSLGVALKEAFQRSSPSIEEPEKKRVASAPVAKTTSKAKRASASSPTRELWRSSKKPAYSFVQYERRKAGIETELVIGFDFGTSSSKVVIQDVDRRQAYAVPFPGLAPTGHDYLLPTKVFVDRSGEFSLVKGDAELAMLKNKLFAGTPHKGPSGAVRPEIAAIAYLALALRETRRYFMQSLVRDVAPGTIVWSINIGLPERYRQLARSKLLETCVLAAWECSVWNEAVTQELTEFWYEEIIKAKHEPADLSYLEDDDKDLHPDQVVAIPEVVAQVQGYARSDLRRTGLHMMIDVGAATLDASTFTLFDRDHEDRYTIWEARVALLGALSLHMHRLRGVSKGLNAHIRKMIGKVDTVSPTASRADMVLDLTEEDIYAIESDFADKAGELLAQMIARTHNSKNPDAKEWRDGLRVFLCGGGRGIPLYRTRLERLPGADGNSGPYSWLGQFQFLELPKPDSLQAPQLVPSDYHRLAVAYGLSFRFDDIGKYEKGTEIEDDEKASERDWRVSFVGPEQT